MFDEDVDLGGRCLLCDSAAPATTEDEFLSPVRVHSSTRPGAVERSSSFSRGVVACHAGSVFYFDVGRSSGADAGRSSPLYTPIYGENRPRPPPRSTAAVVQPYCHIVSDNVSNHTPPASTQPRPVAGTWSSASRPRTSTSSSHYHTAATTTTMKNRDFVRGFVEQ